jgi:hypothetical protein
MGPARRSLFGAVNIGVHNCTNLSVVHRSTQFVTARLGADVTWK